MPTNDFLPFATDVSAEVDSQAVWASPSGYRPVGYGPGILTKEKLNKALRQTTQIAYAIAQLMSDSLNEDVLDNGDTAALLDQLNRAIPTLGLFASDGDELNGMTQPISGAVLRTQRAKNAERVSVKDFGAVGDGVTDDTAAIQAAINYLSATTYGGTTGGGEVWFPPGNYLVTDTLLVGWGVVLRGTACGGFPYLGAQSKHSIITANFTDPLKWVIDSATYHKTGTPGTRIAYNEVVGANIDGDFNSLHGVGIFDLFIISANIPADASAPELAKVIYGAVRLIGCPSAQVRGVTTYGFGVSGWFNTCFGAQIDMQSESLYYGIVGYESMNSIRITGYANRMINPVNVLTVPAGRILPFMPDVGSMSSVFELAAAHTTIPKGIVLAAGAGSSSQVAEIGATLEYWPDTAFLLRAYGVVFNRLYCESTYIQYVLSGAYCSAKVLESSVFAANAKVMDVGFDCAIDFTAQGLLLANALFNAVSDNTSTDNRTQVVVRGISSYGQTQYPRVTWADDAKPLAYVSFNGAFSGTTAPGGDIKNRYNIVAVSRVPGEAVGDYWIDFRRPANATSVRGDPVISVSIAGVASFAYTPIGSGDGIQNTRVRVRCVNLAGTPVDPARVMVTIFG